MELDVDKCEEVIRAAVRKSGETIKAAIYGRDKRVDLKSCEVDLVTESDQQVERDLIAAILENFPDHKIIGEESVAGGAKVELGDDPTWIIDPIDGTMNFVHGYPNVCISVGLLFRKQPVFAIIYNPVLDQWFEARKGRGARLNGDVIKVSSEKELSKALIAFEFGTARDPEKTRVVLGNICNLVPKVHGVRSSGSAALNMAYVASGGADANFEFGIHAWDVAAGWLIVTEAGGIVLDPLGGEFDVLSRRVFCAGTKELADKLIPELLQLHPERD